MENNDNKIKIPTIKIKTLKNGEVKKYTYDQKKYNDKYYKKNKDKINKKMTCTCGDIIKSNYYKHNESIKHKYNMISKEQEIIKKIENDENFNDWKIIQTENLENLINIFKDEKLINDIWFNDIIISEDQIFINDEIFKTTDKEEIKKLIFDYFEKKINN